MARSLSSALRPGRRTVFVLAFSLLIFGLARLAEGSLHDTSFLTGYLLALLLVCLASFSVRKAIVAPPVGRVATWLRLHILGGWLAVFLFCVHVDFRIADGWIEGALAVLFVLTAVSGILGSILNRVLSRRLGHLEEEILLERVQVRLLALRQRAEKIVLEWAEERGEASMVDLAKERILPFLSRPRHLLGHLFGDRGPAQHLLTEMEAHARYLDDDARPALDELVEIVRTKDEIDHHRALQVVLRGWLFVHVPATWSMAVLVVVHAVIAHLYHGGIR